MPVVCITGDVHHPSGTLLRVEEIEATKEYINFISRSRAKATLFVTGKCIMENQRFWREVSEKEYIELGAHTYWAFTFLNKVFDKMLKAPYGPYLYQYYDCWKTVKAFEKINVKPISWRTHSYASDRNTIKILTKFGFKIISDRIVQGELNLISTNGLMNIPINVLNDDVIISEIKKKSDEKSIYNAGKNVFESIKEAVDMKRDIVAQLHPIVMAILDNFTTFNKILALLSESKYKFITLKEMIKNEV